MTDRKREPGMLTLNRPWIITGTIRNERFIRSDASPMTNCEERTPDHDPYPSNYRQLVCRCLSAVRCRMR